MESSYVRVYFRKNHRTYVAQYTKGKPNQCSLWSESTNSTLQPEVVYYLGYKHANGHIEESPELNDLPWDVAKSAQRLFELVSTPAIDWRSEFWQDENMSKQKTERNKLVVQLKDKKGWSFGQIAKELGLKARSTAHEIYHREKDKQKLSTKENLTSVRSKEYTSSRGRI